MILERSHLKLVRSKKDDEYRGDSYIEEYFFHDGKHWRLLNLKPNNTWLMSYVIVRTLSWVLPLDVKGAIGE